MLVDFLQTWNVAMKTRGIVMDYLYFDVFVACLKCFEIVCSPITTIF